MSKKTKENNSGNILLDEVYDGFDYFANDGKDQDRYKYFRTGPFAWPEADEYVLIVDRLNPDRSNVELKPAGFTLLGPGFWHKKFIYVPNPYGPMVIDFKPKDDNDRKENFSFTPGMNSLSDTDSQDEITVDYRVSLKWVNPVKYFYTPRVISILQATIVSIIREYVASHDKNSLFTDFSKLGLEELDPHGKLKTFKEAYGLKVLSLEVNNIKLSDAVQEAKNASAVAKEGVKKAKHEAEAIKIKSNAELNMFRGILDAGLKKGLSPEQSVDFVSQFAAYKASQNPNSNMFFGFGSNSNNQINPMLYAQLASRGKIDNQDDAKVVDAGYSELEDTEDKVKTRKR